MQPLLHLSDSDIQFHTIVQIMAASATASGGARKLCYSMSQCRHLVPTAKRTSTIKFFVENPVHFSSTRTRVKSTIPVRALDPQRDEETENPNINDKTGAFTSQVTLFLSYIFLYTFQIYHFSFVGNFIFGQKLFFFSQPILLVICL